MCDVELGWCLCFWGEVVEFLLFKQKTAYEMRISDWSSDVCSSDLTAVSRRGSRSFTPESEAAGTDGVIAAKAAVTIGFRLPQRPPTNWKVASPARVISSEPPTCSTMAPAKTPNRPCWNSSAISAENDENVVKPPQKPVMISSRHSGARCGRSEEHTSELQSLMRLSYAVF